METNVTKNNMIYDIPLLPLRGITIFPNVLFHFDVGRGVSINAVEKAMEGNQRIFAVTQNTLSADVPKKKDLYTVGTVCVVRQVLKLAGNHIRVLVEGKSLARLERIVSSSPYLSANVSVMPKKKILRLTKRDIAMIRNAKELFIRYASLSQGFDAETIISALEFYDDPAGLSGYIAQNMQLRYTEKQQILEQPDPRKCLAVTIKLLTQEIDVMTLEQEIQEKVKDQLDKNQRDYYLREQIKIINEELGEGEDSFAEAQQYIQRIQSAELPDEVREKLLKEASRMQKMQSFSPESAVSRTYLDVCLDLPWNKFAAENLDIKKAQRILDRDHYGMEKVKERILELFAVKKRTGGVKGQIICLAGPPGVGKTSVARSIASCMGRDYARLSLGGVRDEAEIRGHRKTYIGAMPGRIINALRQAGSRNCLILIDEIDKLGSDYKGDPASALLEVFDTEQNVAFRDHFVELPFDLSDVLFVTTANNPDAIPRPLLDRRERIQLNSYTDEEKLEIAKRHLLPKQLKKHGLQKADIRLGDAVLREIIARYTRESGVRTLERELAKLCRKAAKYMEDSGEDFLALSHETLPEYLGAPKYLQSKPDKLPECGVVNGLAWTSVGGELLEVEAMAVSGTGKLSITGNLGDVMKESVQAALTYIRSRSAVLGLADGFYAQKDVHIHFPEGATPKDGPSAGITAATALLSAFTGLSVPKNIAMTGEITLRGRVLPIGGLKEKTMAAFRNRIGTVILPEENRPDLEEIDQSVRKKLNFVFVSHMDEVVHEVFGDKLEQPQNEPNALPPAVLAQKGESRTHIRR